jgi:hypothetical protein
MGRSLIPILFLSLNALFLPAQIINKVPLSERVTGYNIDVSLDTEAKTVEGTLEGYWVNKSEDTVPDIQMHLYMNAFRNNQTTFFRESGNIRGIDSNDPGYIDLKSFTDGKNRDLIHSINYLSPDDGNPEDRTVIRVKLNDPALPGDTVSVKIGFVTKLSSFLRRSGYNGNYFFVAQWFPKFGVYETAKERNKSEGGWNCHQFHFDSEFFSNHSVYNVSINTPDEYIVGTGGMLMSESESGDGRKTQLFRAEDIVDFAWTAWPGYKVFKDHWQNVEITFLTSKDRVNQVGRQFTAIKYALKYLNDNVGPYPWPYVTFVDPPLEGAGAGGMEYTTLFTSESSYFVPDWIHLPELVTVHEFGHAYFMGILASNEFEEPWMDEGINSFWEERIMDHFYGKNSGLINHPLLKIPDLAQMRIGYVNSPGRQVTSNAQFSWNYPHNTYYMMSYYKAAVIMNTLMGIVGEETINDIFREYYKQWAFRNPSGKDFINIVNEVVKHDLDDKYGSDMNWFFDQTLYGTGICDYRVSGIVNHRNSSETAQSDSSETQQTVPVRTDSLYTAVAELERIGSVMLPVDVLIHFTNGDEVLEHWDGRSRYRDFAYTGEREIEWVKVDPEFKITLDVNYINNSRTIEPDRKPVRRLTDKFISFVQLFISIILL